MALPVEMKLDASLHKDVKWKTIAGISVIIMVIAFCVLMLIPESENNNEIEFNGENYPVLQQIFRANGIDMQYDTLEKTFYYYDEQREDWILYSNREERREGRNNRRDR